jgi:protoheme IX farnesyltransferase
MIATNDTEKGCITSSLITKYTYYLSAMPILSTLTGVTSSMFAIESLFLNGYALYVAKNYDRERSNGSARKVFLTSLWYLPCWMILFFDTFQKVARRY